MFSRQVTSTPADSAGARDAELAYSGPQDWVRTLGVCAAAGLFLALVGAFGTGDAPLGRRLIFWVGLLATGGLIGAFIARRVFASPRFVGRPLLACTTIAALLTPPLAVLVWVSSAILLRADWEPIGILYVLPSVAVVSVAMTAIAYLADRRPRETHASAAATPPRFVDRLPSKLRGAEIYAVEAEDHYLRVHTDRGSDLILMRLYDAVEELEGIEGAQTHRSWWVARNAVVGVERSDGRATFALRNGVRAPVSRTYARALRAEGWY